VALVESRGRAGVKPAAPGTGQPRYYSVSSPMPASISHP
jgi:hypothetical protein